MCNLHIDIFTFIHLYFCKDIVFTITPPLQTNQKHKKTSPCFQRVIFISQKLREDAKATGCYSNSVTGWVIVQSIAKVFLIVWLSDGCFLSKQHPECQFLLHATSKRRMKEREYDLSLATEWNLACLMCVPVWCCRKDANKGFFVCRRQSGRNLEIIQRYRRGVNRGREAERNSARRERWR